MYFRPDNVADVLGLILGLILLILSFMFYTQMKKNEAQAWAEAGYNISLAAAFFTLGMVITFSTAFFYDPLNREMINTFGNVFWVIAAFFSYRMLKKLVGVMGVMLGA